MSHTTGDSREMSYVEWVTLLTRLCTPDSGLPWLIRDWSVYPAGPSELGLPGPGPKAIEFHPERAEFGR